MHRVVFPNERWHHYRISLIFLKEGNLQKGLQKIYKIAMGLAECKLDHFKIQRL